MSVGRSVLVEASATFLRQVPEIEGFDDRSWAQIKVLLHQRSESVVRKLTGPKGFHQNGNGFGHTNGVAELHFSAFSQSCRHKAFGDITRCIGCRTVHFGGVFTGESAATVAGITAIGVDDDLAAGETGISLRSAHHKFARGIHQIFGHFPVRFQGEIRCGWFHDMGPEVFGDPLADSLLIADTGDLFSVLRGNQDGVDRHRLVVFINNTHLGLAVRQQVLESAVVAHFREASRQAVGQADGQGHQLRCLIARVAKHDSLITGTDEIQRVAGMVIGLVHTLGDVRGLLIECDQNGTAVGVKSTCPGSAVADVIDDIADQANEVDLGLGRHLAGDHAQAGIHHRFAGDAAGGILGQKGVEYGITDLIADLVGMALRHGLGGEDVSTHDLR